MDRIEIPTDIAHFRAEFEHWLSFQMNVPDISHEGHYTMPRGYDATQEKHAELIPLFAEHKVHGAIWFGIRTTEWAKDRKDRLPGGDPVNIKLRELQSNRTRVVIYAMPDFKPFGERLLQWVRTNWLMTGTDDGQWHKPDNRRLSDEDVNYRRGIVAAANQWRQANPRMTWRQIAQNIGEPERTLRDWRHNPLYQ